MTYWVTAAGLPLDFEPPPPGDHAQAIRRAAAYGAFVTLLHPGLNNLPLAAAGSLPALGAVHAIEIYIGVTQLRCSASRCGAFLPAAAWY